METLLYLLIGLVFLSLILIIIFRPRQQDAFPLIKQLSENFEQSIDRLTQNLKTELRTNREEAASSAKANREELNQSLADIRREMGSFLIGINKTLSENAHSLNTQLQEAQKANREELSRAIKDFTLELRNKFADLEKRQTDLVAATEKKLEEMRATVDEKLTKTLSERLGESFETVGKQLIEVQKGLGEMQTIATDVGGLKKVLSNVKLRGGVGEVQLAMILEQILAPNQYEANVRTKAGSSDPVEFAIKLPGRSEDESSFVYLPVDAKFPKDVYEHLIAAYENALPDDIEQATKSLENTIRKMAKDIRDKYIDPPHTTDFAIMFLPFEGIYAEVIRRTALVDQLRDEYKITVAGPTTLVAILNSLQMGFRTLALQKRSSEVWRVLGAVKTEFEKFGGMLEKAQRNIHSASDTVDELLGKRSRAISRKLKQVESLPAAEAQKVLPDMESGFEEEEE
ncbi:MAG: DNA recombination protein RmuC [Chitinophagaceae bacterium]|nr:DNA recombination protein RmuC [Chitinophagaceae bacterium]